MGNRGLTTLELIFALTFGLLFIYTAIFIPTELMKSYKEFQKNLDNTLSILSMSKSILNDAPLSDGKICLNENDIIIGNSRYMFLDNGVYRRNKNNLELTKNPFEYKLSEDVFEITGNGISKNNVNLKYNTKFSSFPCEDDYYD